MQDDHGTEHQVCQLFRFRREGNVQVPQVPTVADLTFKNIILTTVCVMTCHFGKFNFDICTASYNIVTVDVNSCDLCSLLVLVTATLNYTPLLKLKSILPSESSENNFKSTTIYNNYKLNWFSFKQQPGTDGIETKKSCSTIAFFFTDPGRDSEHYRRHGRPSLRDRQKTIAHLPLVWGKFFEVLDC